MKSPVSRRSPSLALLVAALASGCASVKAPPPRIHPSVFSMIECWISDTESPVVTEINLDAMERDRNQFPMDEVRQDGAWTVLNKAEGHGFERYRLLDAEGDRFTVEHQSNGGGTLTTVCIIGFSVEQREIRRNGEPLAIRVLRVSSLRDGQSSDPVFGGR